MSTKTKKPTPKQPQPKQPKPVEPHPKQPPAASYEPLTGYDDGTPPERSQKPRPAVLLVGDRIPLRCYRFSVTNTDPNRTIVQIRIPFATPPIVPTGPPDWVVVGKPVTFQTPPPAVGSTVIRPNGIPPLNRLGEFRFYLPKAKDGADTKSGVVEFGFANGSSDGLGGVFQGGKPVTPVGGAFRVDATGHAFCRTLDLCAPKDADVYGVELSRLVNGNETKFVGVEPPQGWAANPVESSIITIFSRGALTPIPAGGTAQATIYYESVNARFRWRFLDIFNQTIPGAEGVVSL